MGEFVAVVRVAPLDIAMPADRRMLVPFPATLRRALATMKDVPLSAERLPAAVCGVNVLGCP
jgi:hypothetical protein